MGRGGYPAEFRRRMWDLDHDGAPVKERRLSLTTTNLRYLTQCPWRVPHGWLPGSTPLPWPSPRFRGLGTSCPHPQAGA